MPRNTTRARTGLLDVAALEIARLRDRLARAEKLAEEGSALLDLMQHGQETSEDCPFCNHSRAVSLFLMERVANGS